MRGCGRAQLCPREGVGLSRGARGGLGVLRGFFCGTSSEMLQIKSQKGAAAARSGSEVVCSGSLACKCIKRGGRGRSVRGQILIATGVGSGMTLGVQLWLIHLGRTPPARPEDPAWRGREGEREGIKKKKKLPPDCFKAEREHFGSGRQRVLRAGTAAGKQSCGWGLRHLGASPQPS